MPQSAGLPILPTCKSADADSLRTAASLLTQSLEDLHLAERIKRALQATGYGALRAIDVSVNARIVHITGRVPSYYLKQIAQATALAVPGTHNIDNDLDVMSPNGHHNEDCRMQQQHREIMDPPNRKSHAADVAPTVQRVPDKLGVLVADDEHIVRITVRLGLERIGFDVWLASDGREAIDLYREHRKDIALVLLDVRMPDLDGPQTLDALRELDPEVLVCFMTGDTAPYEPEELTQRGAAFVIAKPFHLDELTNILRLVADGVPVDRRPNGGTNQG